MDGIVNIRGGKFGWMATNGLLKLKTLFGAKSGDGRSMETSRSLNRANRMPSIKHGKDSALLSEKEGSHDDGG